MIVNIVDKAFPAKIEKLIFKLFKTTLKYTRFNVKKSQVSISFVDKEEIRKLNNQFRKIDKETDVLSFPTEKLIPGEKVDIKNFQFDIDPNTKHFMLGDIIICEDVAKHNAEEYGHSYERELCYLIVHGYLHLLGFDHMVDEDKLIMRAYEESILRKYGITRDFN